MRKVVDSGGFYTRHHIPTKPEAVPLRAALIHILVSHAVGISESLHNDELNFTSDQDCLILVLDSKMKSI